MEHTAVRLRTYLLTTAVLTGIAAVLRSVSLLAYFDEGIGYYSVDAFLPVFFRIFAVIAVLWFGTVFFLINKGAVAATGTSVRFPAAVSGALLGVAFPVLGIYLFFGEDLISVAAYLTIPCAVLSLLSAYYFLRLFLNKPKDADIFSGYAAVLSLLFLLLITYFDRYVVMNAPAKIGLHLTFLSLMLYLLSEFRALIGRSQPRLAAFFSMLAFFLSATVGISGIVAFIGGSFHGTVYLFAHVLCLLFSFYVAFRATDNVFRPAQKPE